MSDNEAGQSSDAGAGTASADKEIAALNFENAKRRKENDALKAELDAIKAERAAQDEERLKKQGEFEKLYNETKGELERLTADLDGYKAKAKAQQERDQAELDKIAATLPEALRDQLTDDIPLERRLSLARALAGSKQTPPGARPPGEGDSGKNPWKKETRNLTEQGRITREDPALAARLKKEAGL